MREPRAFFPKSERTMLAIADMQRLARIDDLSGQAGAGLRWWTQPQVQPRLATASADTAARK
jgi:hypothetical protein